MKLKMPDLFENSLCHTCSYLGPCPYLSSFLLSTIGRRHHAFHDSRTLRLEEGRPNQLRSRNHLVEDKLLVPSFLDSSFLEKLGVV